MRELEELLPQLEGLVAEKEALQARVAALQREAADASAQARHAHAHATRAQEVRAGTTLRGLVDPQSRDCRTTCRRRLVMLWVKNSTTPALTVC